MKERPSNRLPLDYRTAVFCILMGSVLSFPIGLTLEVTETPRPFTPPAWLRPYYFGTVFASFIVLPFWCAYTLHDLPILLRIGIATFFFLLILLLTVAFVPMI